MSSLDIGMDDDVAAETQPLFEQRSIEVEQQLAVPASLSSKAQPVPVMTLRETIIMLVPLVYVPGFMQGLYDYVADPVMPLYASSLGCNPTQV